VTRLGDFGAGGDVGGGHSRGDLRFCITKVNADPGPDDIVFSVTGTINLTGVLPDLASDINMQGPGADQLTVRRDTGGDYRVFRVASGADVLISGLTIANGDAGSSCGGGLLNDGSLTMSDSVVTGNFAGGGSFARGAGICLFNANATMTLTSSFVIGNTAQGTTVYTNGGGIYNAGVMTIDRSVVSGNLASTTNRPALGGGISNRGDLTIIDSSIADNAAVGMCSFMCTSGGGVFNDGFSNADGTLSIYNSTISGNRVENLLIGHNHGREGGGVLNMHVMTILNSTISGNFGASSGGGLSVHQIAPLTVISHSTITGNVSEGDGGGMDTNGNVYMRNTIVAGNTAAANGSDVYGHVNSAGFNVVGNSSGGSGYAPTDILDVDAMLGPLADNGGPTETHALLPGSPAIDAGENSDAPEWDQRGPGFPRIVNGTIDIGSFEVQAPGAPGYPGPAPLRT
jgi:hypothetical protein